MAINYGYEAAKVFDPPAAANMKLAVERHSSILRYANHLQSTYISSPIAERIINPAAEIVSATALLDTRVGNEEIGEVAFQDSTRQAFCFGGNVATEAVILGSNAATANYIGMQGIRYDLGLYEQGKTAEEDTRKKQFDALGRFADKGLGHAYMYRPVLQVMEDYFDTRVEHYKLFARGFGWVMLHAYEVAGKNATAAYADQMMDTISDDTKMEAMLARLLGLDPEQ